MFLFFNRAKKQKKKIRRHYIVWLGRGWAVVWSDEGHERRKWKSQHKRDGRRRNFSSCVRSFATVRRCAGVRRCAADLRHRDREWERDNRERAQVCVRIGGDWCTHTQTCVFLTRFSEIVCESWWFLMRWLANIIIIISNFSSWKRQIFWLNGNHLVAVFATM